MDKKNTLTVNPELFIIPQDKNFIIYSPLTGSILKGNSGLVKLIQKIQKGKDIDTFDKKIINPLIKNGILLKEKQRNTNLQTDIDYSPSSTILMPSFNCNLRCIYCYSEGGNNPGEVMLQEVAKSAIDFIIKNARKTKQKIVGLGFHGGGEPLLNQNIEFIKKSVNYFKEKAEKNGLKSHVSSATNGIISKKNLEWVLDNFDSLDLSLDGPEDIQNKQRPLANGNPSFPLVYQTLKIMEKKVFKYGIRATISEQTVKRMPEILKFFTEISSKTNFHLEPLFQCGRCKIQDLNAPKPKNFLEYALETKKLAKKLEVEFYCAGSDLEDISNYFCGATGKNFIITPQGNVTTCLEVCRNTDPRKETFFIGKYNPKKGEFEFNYDKLKILNKRTVESISNCQDCFSKYNCAGDCLAKIHTQTGDIMDTKSNERCLINQGLLLNEITNKLNEK